MVAMHAETHRFVDQNTPRHPHHIGTICGSDLDFQTHLHIQLLSSALRPSPSIFEHERSVAQARRPLR
jgi:hypothetical protein